MMHFDCLCMRYFQTQIYYKISFLAIEILVCISKNWDIFGSFSRKKWYILIVFGWDTSKLRFITKYPSLQLKYWFSFPKIEIFLGLLVERNDAFWLFLDEMVPNWDLSQNIVSWNRNIRLWFHKLEYFSAF